MIRQLACLVSAVVLLNSCPDDSTRPPGGNAVVVGDFFFNAAQTSVASGSTVTWTWQGSAPHNVTFEDGQGSSTTQTSGTHNRSFGTTGTFRYRCTLHSADFTNGMTGSVVVQ